MDARTVWYRILIVAGGLAMIAGSVDPLDLALVVLSGSVVVMIGLLVGRMSRGVLAYWVWVVILIAAGVTAMISLTAVGGAGGSSGRSVWWGLLALPYPVGWIMALVGAIVTLVRVVRTRNRTTTP